MSHCSNVRKILYLQVFHSLAVATKTATICYKRVATALFRLLLEAIPFD